MKRSNLKILVKRTIGTICSQLHIDKVWDPMWNGFNYESQIVFDFMGEILTHCGMNKWNKYMYNIVEKKEVTSQQVPLGFLKSIGLHGVQFHQDANIMIIYSFGLHINNLVYSFFKINDCKRCFFNLVIYFDFLYLKRWFL